MKTLIAMLMAALALPALAATPLPNGKWSFVFKDEKGRADRPLRVYTYRPRKCETTCPMVIVLAGSKRDASNYRDYWELIADRYSFLVVAPEFAASQWPKAAGYNLGGVADEPQREKWAYAAIEHVFDEVRDGQKGYVLFGHAAGAQFAQRMSLLYPENRATTIVAASPGWYLIPEWRKDKGAEKFPYSLLEAPAGLGEAAVRQALPKRLIVMAGEKDINPDEENSMESDAAKKQGETRVDRAETFIKAATSAANELGVKLAWELMELPDAPQDGQALSRLAGETLYGKK